MALTIVGLSLLGLAILSFLGLLVAGLCGLAARWDAWDEENKGIRRS